jgi:endo-1,4-beta-D-glucanase Y
MRPMSVREMHALCYERGMEFDPAMVPVELAERAQMVLGQPAWEGRSAAQELHELRMAERRERKRVPDWFSVQDLLPEPWEREAVIS